MTRTIFYNTIVTYSLPVYFINITKACLLLSHILIYTALTHHNNNLKKIFLLFFSFDTEALNKNYLQEDILLDNDDFINQFQEDPHKKIITGVQQLYTIGNILKKIIKPC
jgi:hypothetical protein